MNEKYELGKQLGKGAFGEVHKAKLIASNDSNQEVALKSILKSSVTHPVMKELLKNELNTLVLTSHPNIVDVKEILHDDVNYYISSEVVAGG